MLSASAILTSVLPPLNKATQESTIMAECVFANVQMAPPIEVFALSKLYNECTNDNKVNLGVGGEHFAWPCFTI